MPQSKVDPVYKYIDAKIRLIRRDMEKLEQSYNATLDLQEEEMLYLQRFVAKGSVTNMANTCIETVRKLKDQTVKDEVERKLTVAFMAAKSKIDISETPLEIASGFHSKCSKKIHELGLQFLSDSL